MALQNTIATGLRRRYAPPDFRSAFQKGLDARYGGLQAQAPPPAPGSYSYAPPAGSYDPAIDAQIGATQRGLDQLTEDTGTQRTRLGDDYGLGRDAIMRAVGLGKEDLARQLSRGNEDIGTSRTREGEDYTRATDMLRRSYERLAGHQTEGANAAGVIRGGALLQSAAKRSVNQGLEQQGLDTSHTRAGEDLSRAGTRLGEDNATSLQRLTQGGDLDLGQLGVTTRRQFEDLATQLSRGQGEAQAFGSDALLQKIFQATQSGWYPRRVPR